MVAIGGIDKDPQAGVVHAIIAEDLQGIRLGAIRVAVNAAHIFRLHQAGYVRTQDGERCPSRHQLDIVKAGPGIRVAMRYQADGAAAIRYLVGDNQLHPTVARCGLRHIGSLFLVPALERQVDFFLPAAGAHPGAQRIPGPLANPVIV